MAGVDQGRLQVAGRGREQIPGASHAVIEFLHSFADWLVNTTLSVALAKSSWVVPAMQTTHIVAIAILFSAVLMTGLRVMGWAGSDQTLKATVERFRAWIWGSLAVLAMTGIILIVA